MAISDQYVVLMEKTLEENRKLQETITNLTKQLTSPEATASAASPSSPVVSTPKRPTTKVPEHCRSMVRGCYTGLLRKEDFDGFNLSLTFSDSANQETKRRLIRAVQDVSTSSEGCLYSVKVITEAARRYFKSLKDAKHKKDRGKDKDHVIKCRRQARINENCKRMKLGLAKKAWSTEKKKKITTMLVPKYMDEELSDWEETENGRVRMGFKIKKLSWVHSNVRQLQKDLMEEYMRTLTMQQRQQYRQRRVVEEEMSTQEKPKDCPDWISDGLI